MNTHPLPAQVRAIANLLAFSKKSGIPHRTLVRIKAGGDDYPISPVTRLALEAAIKRIKPAMHDPSVSIADAD